MLLLLKIVGGIFMTSKFSFISIASLVITMLGVIAPIVWDYYVDQKGISLSVLSRSVIISPSKDIKGLEVSYKGTKLEYLSKTIFIMENTGNRPLLKAEVVSPVKIKILDDVNVLDTIVESQHPQNIDVSLIQRDGIIDIDFLLLNPGDKIVFSLLANTERINFDASARIAGVNELIVIDEPSEEGSAWGLLWTPVAVLSVILIFTSMSGFYQCPQEWRIKRSLNNHSFVIPDLYNIDEAKDWVVKNFYFMTTEELAPIISCLYRLDSKDSLLNKGEIKRVVSIAVERSTKNLPIAIFIFLVGLFGLYYSVRALGYFYS
ncbi:hypothetical protein [Aeromonas allosaccharophila]|uniref:Uncharacterized protein n=1 Tax=Aeromonas allosaccharophila TaxID=656 RepID=A0A7T2UNB4_9GAMM|nr:hypothetical protein [Aeromonas allosaccharophila]QPR54863.1 hypothetical protein I6G90_21180 [Aeromonas allosaccharophila]